MLHPEYRFCGLYPQILVKDQDWKENQENPVC